MIEILFPSFTPLIFISCAVAMIVLRAGASMVFFDIVGTFQAGRLIKDTGAAMTAFEGLMLDGLSNVEEAVLEVFRPFNELRNATMPIAEDVELARIEFEKFVNETTQAALGDEITEIGNAFGYTAEQSFQAGARMAQLATVMGEAALPAAVEASLAFGLIGEMEARDAQEKMISLMQQTQFIFREVTREEYALMNAEQQRLHVTKEMANTLNALNSIEDNSAAIMPQMVNSMNEYAGAATLAGDSLEFMAAMSAMLIERGVSAQKSGTSLRMAYARLGANINGAADAVEAYGVQVKDSEGNMRGLEVILNELAPTYRSLSEGQRMALAQAIAGNRHYARIVFLMEDLNRVNQLANEGYTQSKAVMDESGQAINYLSDRLDTHHHKLQVARAELDKWQGALGEGFIPATTLATERQADFYQQVVLTSQQLSESIPFLDDIVGRLMAMQQMAEQMYAPFLSALLNIKQLQVAVMTFNAIQRAVTGERIAYFENEARGYGLALNGQYSLNTELGVYNSELWNTISLKQTMIEVEEGIAMANARTHRDRWMALREERAAILQRIADRDTEARNAQSYAYMERLDMDITNKKRQLQRAQQRIKDAEDQKSRSRYRASRRQRQYEYNKLIAERNRLNDLNLTKLDKELQKVNRLYQAERARMSQLSNLNVIIDDAAGEMIYLGDEMEVGSGAGSDMNWQLSEMQQNMMGATMGAMLATGAISLLGDVFFKGEKGAQAARIQMIAMTIASGTMMAQMIHSMKAMSSAAITSGRLASANYSAANSYRALGGAAASAGGAVAGASKGVAGSIGSVLKWAGGIIAISWALEKVLGWLGVWGDADAEDAALSPYVYNPNSADNPWVNDAANIDMWSNSVKNAADQVQDFNNTREELFFGFKAGNITGDLIKQIEQKGIENFVANTEVIQHNHFNGLTTDQVANVILDAIEEEGISRGMSF